MRVQAEFEMLGLRRGDLSSEGIPSFVSLAFMGKLQSSSPTPLPLETADLKTFTCIAIGDMEFAAVPMTAENSHQGNFRNSEYL